MPTQGVAQKINIRLFSVGFRSSSGDFFLEREKKLVLLNRNVYNRPPHFQDIEAEFFNFMVSAKSKAHLLHCAVFMLILTHTYFLPAVVLYL